MTNKFAMLFIAVIVSAFAQAAPTRAAAPVRVSLDQVVRKVSSQNLSVQANALKVYQAKKAISVARGNLLPKLNIWRILSTPFDPQAALGVVGDIAPFLIPGNWFQLKAQKLFYWAETEGYRTLWANEVMASKSVYFHLSYDRMLLSNIEVSKSELAKILRFVRDQEAVGMLPKGAGDEVEIRQLALEEDARGVKALVDDESSLLAIMLGYSATTPIEVDLVPMPDLSKISQARVEDYESRVVTVAPELRQYHYLIFASQYVKKEAMFSMFGIGSLSRGVAGGIFDNVPLQDGLGFGTPASIAISKAQTQVLELQKQGAAEVLKRQLRVAVTNYNLDLQNFPGAKRRVDLTSGIFQRLQDRLSLGEQVAVLDLVEGSRNRILALTALSEAQVRFLVNQDRIKRLAMTEDYSKAPSDESITTK